MDELIEIMSNLLTEIQELNSKIDNIKGFGMCNSISDVCDKIDSLETTITLGSNY